MEKDILVTIIILTYNHEKYIKQALEGCLNQQTDFKYKIIIHDDASTDKTAEIIKEYQAKYPDIIKPIFQTENQYSKGNPISQKYIYPQIESKYVALCEGDDYWIDSSKLQKQVDFLEANPDYSICFHPVKIIYEDKPNKINIFPDKKTLKEEITFEKLLKTNFIQTNSVMYRWRFDNENFKEIIPNNILPGDWYLHLCHAKIGKIGVINKIMSVYRRHNRGIWTDNTITKTNLHKKYGIQELKFYEAVYKNFTNCSEEYLSQVYLPMFKQIIDNYYSLGNIEKIQQIKNLYPQVFERAINIQNPIHKKLEKYKKYYIYLLLISIILIVLNIIQIAL